MAKPNFKRARDQYMYEVGINDFESNAVNYGNPILKTNDDHEFYKLGVEEGRRRVKHAEFEKHYNQPNRAVDIHQNWNKNGQKEA